MNRKTPAGRPESAPDEDPFDFDGDSDGGGPGSSGIRLNKFLAQNGIASRRGADQLIEKGHVFVDGEIVTELGRRIDPATAKVEVDGVLLQQAGEAPRYYLLNKPAGVVCTNDPREARPRAIDLVTDKKKGRIYTIGRLDEDTEGLVILTNDGELANRVSHPRYGVKKVYWADVRGRIEEDAIERMKKGVRLAEGWGAFEQVEVVRRTAQRSILRVTLSEGKNREVRRVFAALDLPVKTLRRIRIGPLEDRKLKVGHWRRLSSSEVGALLAATKPGASGEPKPTNEYDRRQSARRKAFAGSKRPWKRTPLQRPDERRGKKHGPERGGRAARRERKG